MLLGTPRLVVPVGSEVTARRPAAHDLSRVEAASVRT